MAYTNPAAYECFMGRWSARLASPFLTFAGIPTGGRVLDVGCGTGILSRTLLDLAPDIEVVGIDPAASFVDWASRSVLSPRVSFQVGAVEMLSFTDAAFDAAMALLVLQELADPPMVVRELARITRHGGCVAACKWDFENGLPMLSLFWQAAEAVSLDAVARYRASKGTRPEYQGPDDLAALWQNSGLTKVRTAALIITMEFASFEDFWQPFLGGATALCVFARDLNYATEGAVATRLRGMLASTLGMGSFALPARAWAVAGVVAG
jgi:ubiquinone/menaquinone biosynthesis C-methylase UbiE